MDPLIVPLVALLAWWFTPPPAPAPVARPAVRQERIILLPDANGNVGSVIVKTATAEQTLTSAYAAAKPDAQGQLLLEQGNPQTTGQQYARVLNALPAAPVAFTVFFASDSDSALTPESVTVLNRLKAALASRAAPEITLVGHTDRRCSTDYNDALSLRRAQHVRGVLLQAGISATGMDVAGRGEREPLVPTADEVAEEKNRRVEINLR